MITKIYLVENCLNNYNWVYIGKTKNNRKKDHKKVFGGNIIYSYIDEVNSLNRKDWEPLETYWIEQFRQWGFKILNKRKKGGSGPEYQTEEVKNRISQLSKGKNTWRKGKPSPGSGGKGKSKPNSGNRNWSYEHLENIKLAAKTKNKSFYNNSNWIQSQCKIIEQYSLDNNLIKEWLSIKIASNLIGINRSSISQCLNNKQKTAGGFIWKYKKNERRVFT